jgi:flavodoxin
MKALVIYDSVFGNTEKIAHQISEAVKGNLEVRLVNVSAIIPEQLRGMDLLIMGSPTRGFAASDNMKEFLAKIQAGSLKGIKAVVFDTRMDLKNIPFFFRGFVDKGGYAEKPISEALKKGGAELIAPSMGFFVTGQEGPLKAGELERAAAWGKSILLLV